VAKKGQLIFEKAYGHLTYDSLQPVKNTTVYDLASVTKISATTMAIMKLYEQGKISLNNTISHYLPETKTTNKGNILVKDILLHQAGLVAWIPFYRETIDTISGTPNPLIYQSTFSEKFSTQVASNMYMRNDWKDTMYQRILTSKVAAANKYVYSDNDFIFLGKIVERVAGVTIDKYVQENFYTPLGMHTTTFLPNNYLPVNNIAPTEKEKMFRQQLLHGFVHDPGAAMFGGVAGHAGLFSNAEDLAKLYQMLLNGGSYNGTKYFSDSTIQLFTNYQSSVSRRGYGFDKPEKDNATRKEAYPAKYVSSKTFGHTGFTGTCVWADPENDLLYIFLSNRVNPDGGENNKLGKMNIRSRIQEAIYSTIIK
jgi:CubicO group peptidase (beta-lactamase class C family)